DVVELQSIGKTLRGQDILAVKVTSLARLLPDGIKPATLFSATQHAREWIATEVDMRLLKYVVANKRQLRSLLDRTELWFVPVANPDGYLVVRSAPALSRGRSGLSRVAGQGKTNRRQGDSSCDWSAASAISSRCTI